MIRFLLFFVVCISSSYGIDYYYDTDKGAETELSNEDLTRKVRENLRLGWSDYWFQHVSVEVNHGIVTLQGTVPSYEDKTSVESLVKNTDGVKRLISRVRVQRLPSQSKFPSDYSATDADEKLNRTIRNQVGRLLFGSNLKDIHFNTSSGQVKIEGSIENLKDQEKLVTEIRKIQGVNSVTSYLTIKNLQERQSQN